MKFVTILATIITLFTFYIKVNQSEKAAIKMQEFVINISNYTKKYNSNFIIIPQNGIELAYTNINPKKGLNAAYMDAVNGFGVEELFYNGSFVPDKYRLSLLQSIKTSKKIIVSEYVTDKNKIQDAIYQNNKEGFICFLRSKNNYNYTQIPENIATFNTLDISNLSDAKNFLYLISSNKFLSKIDMIKAISETNYDVVLIDLFFNEIEFTSAEINQLKKKANGGKRLVISYISIGSAEKYRYYWKKNWGLHQPIWLKKKYEGYKDEFWVMFWKKEWQDIIYGNDNSYLKKILNAGFDGAYLDNVEAYYFLYHNQ